MKAQHTHETLQDKRKQDDSHNIEVIPTFTTVSDKTQDSILSVYFVGIDETYWFALEVKQWKEMLKKRK